ncbi:MAG: pyruvate, phosphate dikinase, partial [Nitrospinota bacterium]
LQTRSGKRTAVAAVNIAVEMVKEKLIDKETALLRVDPQQLEQLLHPMVDPAGELNVIAKGLPASPGAAVGTIVFNAVRAEERVAEGEKVILVRTETSPEDIGGMDVSQGILTERGGMTSHAAVVARGMGTCCVVGCSEVSIDEASGSMTVNGKVYKEGDFISLDGTTGRVMEGEIPLIEPELSGNFSELMSWADDARTLKIRTNADTPHDAKTARDFGAEGIGLCRTEHMFFEEERILAVREMILADNREERKKALAKIMPMQKGDFKGIFQSMEGLPVTIRLFDPPLHEFLPHSYDELKEIGDDMGVEFEKIRDKMSSLKELNPMLGHRGCRLGISFPAIYEMQVQAIIEAACELYSEGKTVEPEIMIPLVGHVNELSFTKKRVIDVAEEVIKEKGVKVKYTVGTMIELPRAAITADQIAKEADFFSFGTNDLTQTAFGFSRDDVGSFLGFYIENDILKVDPFVAIDREGVGELIKMGASKGRQVKPSLKIGICGEHGGEPSSIEFCHDIGLDYVSCSPYRVPVARLAAAQAKLGEKERGKA